GADSGSSVPAFRYVLRRAAGWPWSGPALLFAVALGLVLYHATLPFGCQQQREDHRGRRIDAPARRTLPGVSTTPRARSKASPARSARWNSLSAMPRSTALVWRSDSINRIDSCCAGHLIVTTVGNTAPVARSTCTRSTCAWQISLPLLSCS